MVSEGEAALALCTFFKERWVDQVEEFALQYPDSTSLEVDYWALRNYNRELERLIEDEPQKLFSCAALALKQIEFPVDVEFKDVDLRVSGFPTKTPIRNIRHKHIQTFIKVEGIIRRCSDVKPKYSEIAFECVRCGHITLLPQPQRIMVEPYECESQTCGKKGPFIRNHQLSKYDDFQILEIQESPDSLRGTQPRNLTVHVYNELTDVVTTGDKVVISGVLVTSHQVSKEGKSTVSDIVLEANHIEKVDKSYDELEITEKDREEIEALANDPEIKSKLVKSIAPSIYGLDKIKEALLLQLMSGCVKNLPDGTRIRGDIHTLLIGDPGTAKSQLVKRVVDLSPRGVFNSGKSASGVGLTAAVVKDSLNDDRWTLEGGSLVMADTGLCVVDEMDKMRSEDVSALHEAMEQQVITVSKAGIHAQLMTRCALVAAANPIQGRFDKYDTDIGGQINMPPALLSRFDLIFVIQDIPDRDNDERIADHISNNHMQLMSESFQPIDSEMIRKYVAYARANVRPCISIEARNAIKRFYVDVRNMQIQSNAIPITARSIDGLYRLAEASAKVRLSEVVTEQDAKDAITLVATCLKQVGFDESTGLYNIDMLLANGSKSQRTKIHDIKEYMRGVDVSSTSGICEALGINFEECNSYLRKMCAEGTIMRVGADTYRTT